MSPSANQLTELARQVRGEMLRLLAAAPEPWLTWAPPGTSNHILWHAGHALWLQDVLFVERVTGKSELPSGWAETFGMNCRPLEETDKMQAWPRRSEIERHLTQQLNRVLQLLRELPAERLAADARPSHGNRNLLSSLIHAWHDEAKHQGEMYLLLKMHKAQRAQ
jgi:DinB superfamily